MESASHLSLDSRPQADNEVYHASTFAYIQPISSNCTALVRTYRTCSMRSDRCGECGDEFVWDSDAGSAVCPSCGMLQDSSQVVLDSHIEPDDSARERDTFSFYHRSTLKSFRGSRGWDLAGQGSLPATERNKIAMREFISALTHRIGHPSLTRRTLFLFEFAFERGRFRYGRKANLVAGASLAIALRENQKGETVKDIAYLLNESNIALAQVFRTVASIVDVKLASVDPSWHLPTLQKHLVELLDANPRKLPNKLVKILKNIHLPSAFRTAASLSEVTSRANIAVNLPSQSTACAMYILALEGEASCSLPHCGELATALGKRFDISGEVVMRRYRLIYDHIDQRTSHIPWLAGIKNAAIRKSTKVAKRVGVARCLKDVVQHEENVWREKLEASGPLSMTSSITESVSSYGPRVGNEINLEPNDTSIRPRKRRKTVPLDDVSRFLLSPLYTTGSTEIRLIDRKVPSESVVHILISESPSFNQPPSRLQLLAAVKSADEITDEELFGEGELESFLRTPEERETFLRTCDWAREDDELDNREAHARHVGKGRPAFDPGSRMNDEALAGLLGEEGLINWVQNEGKDDDYDDNSWILGGSRRQTMTHADGLDEKNETNMEAGDDSHQPASLADDEEEIIGPWRPLSPDNG